MRNKNIHLPINNKETTQVSAAMDALYQSGIKYLNGFIVFRKAHLCEIKLPPSKFYLYHDFVQFLDFPVIHFSHNFSIPARHVASLIIQKKSEQLTIEALCSSTQTFDTKRLKILNNRFYAERSHISDIRTHGNQGRAAKFVSGGLPGIGRK